MLEVQNGITIVMPCLNEEKTLGVCIAKASTALSEIGMDCEILVADNGSTDASINIALDNGARVVNVKEKGYGSALRAGIEAAKYEYIIMGDADDSYDFSNIKGFVEKLDDGYELVMGNRFGGTIHKGAMPFSHRYIGNPILSGIGRLFFKTKIKDFHCGLRAFRKTSIQKLGLCTTGMEFASEMVVKASIFDLKITEVSCDLFPDGRDRPPHLRSIPDGLRHLEFLFLYSPKWLFVYPGILLFFGGLIFMIMIYIKPIHIGNIQFETTSMLYSSLAMLIGLQFVQFSVFAGNIAKKNGQIPKLNGFSQKINRLLNFSGYKVALIIMLIGIVGVIYTLCVWGKTGFGELTTTMVCKTAIVFGSLLSTGIEVLLFTLLTRINRLCEGDNE